MSKEALRKFHMNLLNHCDEFLELNVDIRIIDDYALQLANELEQALTTDHTLEVVKEYQEKYTKLSHNPNENRSNIGRHIVRLDLLYEIISEAEDRKNE